MMASKDGVSQVIKTFGAVVALIALTGRFRVITATPDDVCGLTRGTHDAVEPAQLTNRLITLDIVDEMRDVDLHGWTPVRDRGMGWRQYTPSSNATTLESKKSDLASTRMATAPREHEHPLDIHGASVPYCSIAMRNAHGKEALQ
jgi:hypothetical protein